MWRKLLFFTVLALGISAFSAASAQQITIDGLFDDWNAVTTSFTDATGANELFIAFGAVYDPNVGVTPEQQSYMDIKEVKITNDAEKLYVMIEVVGGPKGDIYLDAKDVWEPHGGWGYYPWQVILDTDNNYDTGLKADQSEVAVLLASPESVHMGVDKYFAFDINNDGTIDTGGNMYTAPTTSIPDEVDLPGAERTEAAYQGNQIEMSCPLDVLGLSIGDTIRFFTYVRIEAKEGVSPVLDENTGSIYGIDVTEPAQEYTLQEPVLAVEGSSWGMIKSLYR